MQRERWLINTLAGALVLVAMPAMAQAGYVYLNGVPAAGLRGQKFEGCTVEFDAAGNVRITAPGVEVRSVPQPGSATPPALAPAPAGAATSPPPTPPLAPPASPAASPPMAPAPAASTPEARPAPPAAPPDPPRTGPLTQRYFLVALQSTPGIAQYDVDVYVNRVHVRKVRSRESQVTFELTPFLRWGRNEVQFAATKDPAGGERRSSLASDHLRLVIGPGVKGGGTVKLTEILADFHAPASRQDNFGDSQVIELK